MRSIDSGRNAVKAIWLRGAWKVASSIVLTCACGFAQAQAQPLLTVAADGSHHWASHPADAALPALEFRSVTQAGYKVPRIFERTPARDALLQLIVDFSVRYDVEPAWVLALIEVESNFNVQAVSPKGAIGLMQLMPGTARGYGLNNPRDLFRPEVNLDIGLRHLKALLDRNQNNWPVVLAAYNAGEGVVSRKGPRIPAFKETLLYVPSVLSRVEAHRLHLATASIGRPQ